MDVPLFPDLRKVEIQNGEVPGSTDGLEVKRIDETSVVFPLLSTSFPLREVNSVKILNRLYEGKFIVTGFVSVYREDLVPYNLLGQIDLPLR